MSNDNLLQYNDKLHKIQWIKISLTNYLYKNSGNCFYTKRCVRVCNILLIEILQFAIHNKKKEI